MIIRLILLIGLPIMAYYGVKSLSQRYGLSARLTRYLYFTVVALLVIGVLIIMGRLPVQFILAPLGLAATFLLRALPTLLRLFPLWQMFKSKLGSAGQRSSGNSSKIKTKYLVMELDHDSGDLSGEVVAGQFAGISVAELGLERLIQLHKECAADQDSQQVLEAYLDRYHEQWQSHTESSRNSSAASDDNEMSKSLAMEILGLEGDVSKESVQTAYRSLMQKLHPDRGGSEYLAKKINQAKEVLMQDLS
jgi:hypothetical protein